MCARRYYACIVGNVCVVDDAYTCRAAMLRQRAQNSMFDQDDDEWGDTDELINKVQSRKNPDAGRCLWVAVRVVQELEEACC